MTIFLAVASAILGGSADFLGGTASRRLPVGLVVGVSQAVALAVLTVLITASQASRLDMSCLAPATASGAFMLLGLVGFYAALASGTMSIVAPIAALGVVVPLGWSLLIGEAPARIQYAGIVVAIAGVMLASGPEMRRPAGVRPLLLACLAALGFGSSMLFYSQSARVDMLTSLFIMKIVIILPFVLWVPFRLRLSWRTRKQRLFRTRVEPGQLLVLVAIAGADLAANLSFGFAATRDLISVVSVLGSLYPVATVLLARWVHGEYMTPSQRYGVMAAIGGVVLISAG